MAMTANGLSASLHTELQGKFTIVDDTVLQQFCDACGKAIVEYVQANAEVLPNTLNNPSGQPVTVSTSSGVGATTSPQVIQGKGKVN